MHTPTQLACCHSRAAEHDVLHAKLSAFAFHSHSIAVFPRSSAVSVGRREQASFGTGRAALAPKAAQCPLSPLSTVGIACNWARKPRAHDHHPPLGWPCSCSACLVSDCDAICWSQMRNKVLALFALVAALALAWAGSAAAAAAAGAQPAKPPKCAQVPDASFQAAAANMLTLCPELKEDSCPDDCVSALTTVGATAVPAGTGHLCT